MNYDHHVVVKNTRAFCYLYFDSHYPTSSYAPPHALPRLYGSLFDIQISVLNICIYERICRFVCIWFVFLFWWSLSSLLLCPSPDSVFYIQIPIFLVEWHWATVTNFSSALVSSSELCQLYPSLFFNWATRLLLLSLLSPSQHLTNLHISW